MSRLEGRRWYATAVWLLAAGLSCGSALAARLALVIGNDTYEQVSKLRNARADAQTMADALRSAGYSVDLRTDRTQREMLDDVRSFRQRIQGGDEVVLFFSGHGVQIGASNHLLPTNVRSQNEDQVRDDALELSRVLADLRSAKPAFTLAIIDACRDNPFAGTGRAIGGRGLTGVAGANGQMVIYAAGEGQQALDRLGNNDTVRNGVFTRVFARELQKPGVPVHQVLRTVRAEVSRLAQTVGHVQVPAIYDQALGDFYFVAGAAGSNPGQPVAAAPAAVAQPAPPLTAYGPVAGQTIKDCGECPEMVVIPGGSFMMGSPEIETGRSADEGPQRRVSISAFALGKTEVTQGHWRVVMASNPSRFSSCGDECPVEQVSWDDAQEFIRRLNAKTGKVYRLPSEAEWEYAARAATTTPFHTGATISSAQANYDGNHAYGAGGKGPYRQKTVGVASFGANGFGLHDMHGNVWEWVQDCYDKDAYAGKAPNDGRAYEATGCSSRVSDRVLRGGSWFSHPFGARSAGRFQNGSAIRSSGIGFRLARMLP